LQNTLTPPRDESLKDRLEKTPPEELQGGVKTVEKLGEADYNDAERASEHTLRKNWNTVKSRSHWVLFVIFVILVIAAAGSLVSLLYVYISKVVKDPMEAKALLINIWDTLLVVGATLFIENKFEKK